ncbi:acyl-homoserine-lactone synthase [Aeromonas cavernicola]|uniref:Acyl-homoserine-lactone synthase n=1 Tax=Aeromonas cavernicola TaxID=1006623 RepID=A0A2H9U1P2_9GAMM|nr:acyl-homoserine-lactone synthase [Aeromonas cavernicola]PJG57976.1 acyl-homoserine-lactone synthase [Aeromonas cavernicola]
MLVFKGKLRDHPRNNIEDELYRFRNQIFSGRLGWDVESHQGLERDSFDSPDTYWVLLEDDQGICGCIRMLDCSGNYMLSTVFPTALAGESPPCTPDIWELTRLAIDANRAPRMENGISEITFVILREVYAFAKENGIREVVGVASLPAERIYRKIGIPMERLGHCQSVDLGAVRGVGLRFHLNDHFGRIVSQTLLGHYQNINRKVEQLVEIPTSPSPKSLSY